MTALEALGLTEGTYADRPAGDGSQYIDWLVLLEGWGGHVGILGGLEVYLE